MRDGVRLSADVYLPRSAGSFPTILTRTPYESGRDAFITLAVWFARRGYAFVIQDCRGRYESEGVFHAYAHEHRPPQLALENYPHLPTARVSTTAASDYLALLGAGCRRRL